MKKYLYVLFLVALLILATYAQVNVNGVLYCHIEPTQSSDLAALKKVKGAFKPCSEVDELKNLPDRCIPQKWDLDHPVFCSTGWDETEGQYGDGQRCDNIWCDRREKSYSQYMIVDDQGVKVDNPVEADLVSCEKGGLWSLNVTPDVDTTSASTVIKGYSNEPTGSGNRLRCTFLAGLTHQEYRYGHNCLYFRYNDENARPVCKSAVTLQSEPCSFTGYVNPSQSVEYKVIYKAPWFSTLGYDVSMERSFDKPVARNDNTVLNISDRWILEELEDNTLSLRCSIPQCISGSEQFDCTTKQGSTCENMEVISLDHTKTVTINAAGLRGDRVELSSIDTSVQFANLVCAGQWACDVSGSLSNLSLDDMEQLKCKKAQCASETTDCIDLSQNKCFYRTEDLYVVTDDVACPQLHSCKLESECWEKKYKIGDEYVSYPFSLEHVINAITDYHDDNIVFEEQCFYNGETQGQDCSISDLDDAFDDDNIKFSQQRVFKSSIDVSVPTDCSSEKKTANIIVKLSFEASGIPDSVTTFEIETTDNLKKVLDQAYPDDSFWGTIAEDIFDLAIDKYDNESKQWSINCSINQCRSSQSPDDDFVCSDENDTCLNGVEIWNIGASYQFDGDIYTLIDAHTAQVPYCSQEYVCLKVEQGEDMYSTGDALCTMHSDVCVQLDVDEAIVCAVPILDIQANNHYFLTDKTNNCLNAKRSCDLYQPRYIVVPDEIAPESQDFDEYMSDTKSWMTESQLASFLYDQSQSGGVWSKTQDSTTKHLCSNPVSIVQRCSFDLPDGTFELVTNGLCPSKVRPSGYNMRDSEIEVGCSIKLDGPATNSCDSVDSILEYTMNVRWYILIEQEVKIWPARVANRVVLNDINIEGEPVSDELSTPEEPVTEDEPTETIIVKTHLIGVSDEEITEVHSFEYYNFGQVDSEFIEAYNDKSSNVIRLPCYIRWCTVKDGTDKPCHKLADSLDTCMAPEVWDYASTRQWDISQDHYIVQYASQTLWEGQPDCAGTVYCPTVEFAEADSVSVAPKQCQTLSCSGTQQCYDWDEIAEVQECYVQETESVWVKRPSACPPIDHCNMIKSCWTGLYDMTPQDNSGETKWLTPDEISVDDIRQLLSPRDNRFYPMQYSGEAMAYHQSVELDYKCTYNVFDLSSPTPTSTLLSQRHSAVQDCPSELKSSSPIDEDVNPYIPHIPEDQLSDEYFTPRALHLAAYVEEPGHDCTLLPDSDVFGEHSVYKFILNVAMLGTESQSPFNLSNIPLRKNELVALIKDFDSFSIRDSSNVTDAVEIPCFLPGCLRAELNVDPQHPWDYNFSNPRSVSCTRNVQDCTAPEVYSNEKTAVLTWRPSEGLKWDIVESTLDIDILRPVCSYGWLVCPDVLPTEEITTSTDPGAVGWNTDATDSLCPVFELDKNKKEYCLQYPKNDAIKGFSCYRARRFDVTPDTSGADDEPVYGVFWVPEMDKNKCPSKPRACIEYQSQWGPKHYLTYPYAPIDNDIWAMSVPEKQSNYNDNVISKTAPKHLRLNDLNTARNMIPIRNTCENDNDVITPSTRCLFTPWNTWETCPTAKDVLLSNNEYVALNKFPNNVTFKCRIDISPIASVDNSNINRLLCDERFIDDGISSTTPKVENMAYTGSRWLDNYKDSTYEHLTDVKWILGDYIGRLDKAVSYDNQIKAWIVSCRQVSCVYENREKGEYHDCTLNGSSLIGAPSDTTHGYQSCQYREMFTNKYSGVWNHKTKQYQDITNYSPICDAKYQPQCQMSGFGYYPCPTQTSQCQSCGIPTPSSCYGLNYKLNKNIALTGDECTKMIDQYVASGPNCQCQLYCSPQGTPFEYGTHTCGYITSQVHQDEPDPIWDSINQQRTCSSTSIDKLGYSTMCALHFEQSSSLLSNPQSIEEDSTYEEPSYENEPIQAEYLAPVPMSKCSEYTDDLYIRPVDCSHPILEFEFDTYQGTCPEICQQPYLPETCSRLPMNPEDHSEARLTFVLRASQKFNDDQCDGALSKYISDTLKSKECQCNKVNNFELAAKQLYAGEDLEMTWDYTGPANVKANVTISVTSGAHVYEYIIDDSYALNAGQLSFTIPIDPVNFRLTAGPATSSIYVNIIDSAVHSINQPEAITGPSLQLQYPYKEDCDALQCSKNVIQDQPCTFQGLVPRCNCNLSTKWLDEQCFNNSACNTNKECQNMGYYGSTDGKCDEECTCPAGHTPASKCTSCLPESMCNTDHGLKPLNGCYCDGCYRGYGGRTCNQCTAYARFTVSKMNQDYYDVFIFNDDRESTVRDRLYFESIFFPVVYNTMAIGSTQVVIDQEFTQVKSGYLQLVLRFTGDCSEGSAVVSSDLFALQATTISEIMSSFDSNKQDIYDRGILPILGDIGGDTEVTYDWHIPTTQEGLDFLPMEKPVSCLEYPDQAICRENEKESKTGLVVGLVVGIIGGAILIALIILIICIVRNKDKSNAPGKSKNPSLELS